jgi:hypothetical protein
MVMHAEAAQTVNAAPRPGTHARRADGFEGANEEGDGVIELCSQRGTVPKVRPVTMLEARPHPAIDSSPTTGKSD